MNNRRTNNTKQESYHSLAAHPFSGTADRCRRNYIPRPKVAGSSPALPPTNFYGRIAQG